MGDNEYGISGHLHIYNAFQTESMIGAKQMIT